MTEALKGMFPGNSRLRQGMPGGRAAIPGALAIVGVILAVTAIVFLLRAAFKGGKSRKGVTITFYHEMERALKKKGIVRPPAVTPLEFARGLKAKNGDLYEGVVYVTELYNRARFGGWEPGKDELARVREILARMNTA